MSNTAKTSQAKQNITPLCIDLDGTLIESDILIEQFIFILRHDPKKLMGLFKNSSKISKIKKYLSENTHIDVPSLPFRKEILDDIKNQDQNRPIHLVTGTRQEVAEEIASHLGVFHSVWGSTDDVNLVGKNKTNFLANRFGEYGFDYYGDSIKDKSIFEVSREWKLFKSKKLTIHSVLKQLRVHHWAKNILIVVAPVLALSSSSLAYIQMAIGFMCFSLMASAVYCMNDIIDLPSDRVHPTKKKRPLASGNISWFHGVFLFAGLFFSSLAISITTLPLSFTGIISLYFATNLLYSVKLKTVPMLDVFILGSFYIMRILAGAAICSVTVSHWLLTFAVFLFLSLASLKRMIEFNESVQTIEKRGYKTYDKTFIESFGLTNAQLSCVVFALYLQSSSVTDNYSTPAVLWVALILIFYWINHLWFKAHRQELKEDPVLFALRDPLSRCVGIGVFIAWIAAAYFKI